MLNQLTRNTIRDYIYIKIIWARFPTNQIEKIFKLLRKHIL